MNRSTFLKTLLVAPAGLLALGQLSKATSSDGFAPGGVIPIGDHLPLQPCCVQGPAIKVPSNRFAGRIMDSKVGTYTGAIYVGPWDGTFKLERGCSNPAYVLADLIERTGTEPDWVTHASRDDRGVAYADSKLNWQMLYHWGSFYDEIVWARTDGGIGWPGTGQYQPRFTVSTTITHQGTVASAPYKPRLSVDAPLWTSERAAQLREDLRMHCLSWQSTDPRYRTSWPGVPYPGDHS